MFRWFCIVIKELDHWRHDGALLSTVEESLVEVMVFTQEISTYIIS